MPVSEDPEIRRRNKVSQCPRCEGNVLMESETEDWVKHRPNGRMVHRSFGPWSGECKRCNVALCDSGVGYFVIDLTKEKEEDENDREGTTDSDHGV